MLYGLTETLAMTLLALEAAQAQLLGAIQDECRRINALVDNLLDMARLQTGEIRLNRAVAGDRSRGSAPRWRRCAGRSAKEPSRCGCLPSCRWWSTTRC